MKASVSITRRLTGTVLVLELLAALILIGAVTIYEQHTQFKAFDASLEAGAESLMGAVQDAEDAGDNVMLDMRGLHIDKKAVFRVEDERGRVLGSAGELPSLNLPSSGRHEYMELHIHNRGYRFVILRGIRVVDPGNPNGGKSHAIKVVYGRPVSHVWHEVLESVQFFAIATGILLGFTALFLAWLVRRELAPITQLAAEAERISSLEWRFDAPASARNTVELRPLATALESALNRLQCSFEQQKHFTNDAAHELKTDVAIIKSSLQLLSMRKRTEEEYSRGLALCLQDVSRLETTVQKMLTLARLEQPLEDNHLQNAIRQCSLRNAVEEAVHQSRPLAELKRIQVIVECAEDASVPLDHHDALLLCSNILLNALQYSPEGAIVRLVVIVNGEVTFAVEDQGQGIAEQDRAHLFQPFYRGDPSRSRKSGGTGLGLSICKAICERVGGSIQIQNRAEGGARVIVKLPQAQAPDIERVRISPNSSPDKSFA